MLSKRELLNRAKKVRLILMDVDGVLTRGDIIVHDDGTETKVFNVQDGHGIRLAHRAGLRTGIITGRKSQAVEHRAKDLGIDILYQKSIDKVKDFLAVIERLELVKAEVVFIGDDFTDIPVIRQVGIGVAVANARREVKEIAHYVTKAEGGKGAVREVIELVLKASGLWKSVTERYFGEKVIIARDQSALEIK